MTWTAGQLIRRRRSMSPRLGTRPVNVPATRLHETRRSPCRPRPLDGPGRRSRRGQPTWNFGDGIDRVRAVGHAHLHEAGHVHGDGRRERRGRQRRGAVDADDRDHDTGRAAAPTLPKTTVAKPKVKASYVASHLVGSVTLTGPSRDRDQAHDLAAQARRQEDLGDEHVRRKGRQVVAHSLKLPGGLLPGEVRRDGVRHRRHERRRRRSRSRPRSRASSSARYATGPRRGPAATTLTGTNELWAHFALLRCRRRARRSRPSGSLPNGSKLGANTRPRTSLVEAQVKDLSGKALPTGRWRCVITVGKVVVATLNVRLK